MTHSVPPPLTVSRCQKRDKQEGRRQYLLDAELPHCVVHQDGHVFYRYTNVPIGPAALVWPVLGALTLERNRHASPDLRPPTTSRCKWHEKDHESPDRSLQKVLWPLLAL